MKRTMSERSIVELLRWKTRHIKRQHTDPEEAPQAPKKVNSVQDLLLATKIFKGA
jgi:hypothetical protein